MPRRREISRETVSLEYADDGTRADGADAFFDGSRFLNDRVPRARPSTVTAIRKASDAVLQEIAPECKNDQVLKAIHDGLSNRQEREDFEIYHHRHQLAVHLQTLVRTERRLEEEDVQLRQALTKTVKGKGAITVDNVFAAYSVLRASKRMFIETFVVPVDDHVMRHPLFTSIARSLPSRLSFISSLSIEVAEYIAELMSPPDSTKKDQVDELRGIFVHEGKKGLESWLRGLAKDLSPPDVPQNLKTMDIQRFAKDMMLHWKGNVGRLSKFVLRLVCFATQASKSSVLKRKSGRLLMKALFERFLRPCEGSIDKPLKSAAKTLVEDVVKGRGKTVRMEDKPEVDDRVEKFVKVFSRFFQTIDDVSDKYLIDEEADEELPSERSRGQQEATHAEDVEDDEDDEDYEESYEDYDDDLGDDFDPSEILEIIEAEAVDESTPVKADIRLLLKALFETAEDAEEDVDEEVQRIQNADTVFVVLLWTEASRIFCERDLNADEKLFQDPGQYENRRAEHSACRAGSKATDKPTKVSKEIRKARQKARRQKARQTKKRKMAEVDEQKSVKYAVNPIAKLRSSPFVDPTTGPKYFEVVRSGAKLAKRYHKKPYPQKRGWCYRHGRDDCTSSGCWWTAPQHNYPLAWGTLLDEVLRRAMSKPCPEHPFLSMAGFTTDSASINHWVSVLMPLEVRKRYDEDRDRQKDEKDARSKKDEEDLVEFKKLTTEQRLAANASKIEEAMRLPDESVNHKVKGWSYQISIDQGTKEDIGINALMFDSRPVAIELPFKANEPPNEMRGPMGAVKVRGSMLKLKRNVFANDNNLTRLTTMRRELLDAPIRWQPGGEPRSIASIYDECPSWDRSRSTAIKGFREQITFLCAIAYGRFKKIRGGKTGKMSERNRRLKGANSFVYLENFFERVDVLRSYGQPKKRGGTRAMLRSKSTTKEFGFSVTSLAILNFRRKTQGRKSIRSTLEARVLCHSQLPDLRRHLEQQVAEKTMENLRVTAKAWSRDHWKREQPTSSSPDSRRLKRRRRNERRLQNERRVENRPSKSKEKKALYPLARIGAPVVLVMDDKLKFGGARFRRYKRAISEMSRENVPVKFRHRSEFRTSKGFAEETLDDFRDFQMHSDSKRLQHEEQLVPCLKEASSSHRRYKVLTVPGTNRAESHQRDAVGALNLLRKDVAINTNTHVGVGFLSEAQAKVLVAYDDALASSPRPLEEVVRILPKSSFKEGRITPKAVKNCSMILRNWTV